MMSKAFMDLLEPITENLRKVAPGFGLKINDIYIDQLIDAHLGGAEEPNRAGLRMHLLDFLARYLNCRWKPVGDGQGIYIYRPKPPAAIVSGIPRSPR